MIMRQRTLEETEFVWTCGYSGRDDTLPTASETKAAGGHVTDQKILGEALAVVKAAGYRVSKPKTPEHKDPSPTLTATFVDGTTVRMTTFSSLEKLDWNRGERLARHAWASRHKVLLDWDSSKLAKIAPSISACRFEQGSKVLAQRNGRSVP